MMPRTEEKREREGKGRRGEERERERFTRKENLGQNPNLNVATFYSIWTTCASINKDVVKRGWSMCLKEKH